MAVLLITHDLGVVADDRATGVVVMYGGQVMESGPVADIFHDPRHPYLKALLAAVPRFDMGEGERLKPIRELKQKLGGQLMQTGKEVWPSEAHQKPLLEVKNLTKRYYSRRGGGLFGGRGEAVVAVDDVSFHIDRGEILGLVGESGCGKSTLSKLLLQAFAPDDGNILFNDRGHQVDVPPRSRARGLTRFRRKVQYMFPGPVSAR